MSILEPFSRAVGAVLTTSYDLLGSPALAVVATTSIVALLAAPWLVRSMLVGRRSAALAPQLERLRAEHADDPVALSSASLALYKANGASPFGALGATLAQGAVFALLLHVVRGVFHRGALGLVPRHLAAGSSLGVALTGAATVPFFGADLAGSGWAALTAGPGAAALYLVLAIGVGLASVAQQRIVRRSASAATAQPPAVQALVRVLSWSWLAWGLAVPVAVSLSVATSSIVRLLATVVAHRQPLPPT